MYEVEGPNVETTRATGGDFCSSGGREAILGLRVLTRGVRLSSISTCGEVMPGTVDPTTLLPDWFGPDQEDKERRRGSDRSESSLAVTTEECGLQLGTYVSKFEVKVAGTPTIALGDGGADYSIISEDFAVRVFGLEWMRENIMKPTEMNGPM